MPKKKDNVEYRDDKDLRVLSAAELMSVKSLPERINLMTENRNAVFIHNLEYLRKKHELSQAQLCEGKLDSMIHSAQLSGYKLKGKDIPLRTMSLVACAFGYTVEQLCGQLLDQEDIKTNIGDKHSPRPFEEYLGFFGTYEFAYFTDNVKMGAKLSTAASFLGKGLLTIYLNAAVDGVPVVRVEAMVDCTPDEQDKLLAQLKGVEAKGGGRGFVTVYEKATENCPERYYKGEMLLTATNAILKLQQKRGNDELMITLRNRAGATNDYNHYFSGLGTLSHSSFGNNQIPRVQAVALSKKGFAAIAKEELVELLLMGPAKVDIEKEVKDIITYMHTVYPKEGDSPMGTLSLDDETFLLESFVTRKLTQVLKRSVFGCYTVTTEQDYMVYNACKGGEE